jgi:hypothetical protein
MQTHISVYRVHGDPVWRKYGISGKPESSISKDDLNMLRNTNLNNERNDALKL